MYMFFWFFKQLFYILKRFIKHKLLLLFLFFIIALLLFYKPSYASTNLEYTSLQYIQSTGTQYIDTGFSPTNTSKIVIDYQLVNLKSYDEYGIRFFGIGAIGPGTPIPSRFALGVSNNNEFYYGIGDVNINKSLNISLTERVTSFIDLYTGTYGINDYTYNLYDINYSNPNNLSAYLFARRGTDNKVEGLCNIKIFDVKLYNNNILIKHFIPCKLNSTNEIGMWDIINDEFYSNIGTGSFIAGYDIEPYITTSSNSIINFSFNNLNINANFLNYNDSYELVYTYPNNSTSYTGNINKYKTNLNNQLFFNIPRTFFTNDIIIRSGSRIAFDLYQYHMDGNDIVTMHYNLGYYDLNLTNTEQEIINQDSDKQILSDISKNQEQTTQAIDNLNNSQQETTNAINNLDNTITDDDVNFQDIDLPTDDSEDITQNGVNNIFTSIYNAFCIGQAQDIIFPIPFTNKSITLSANYVRQMLSNSGSSWVITIVEAFWWYLISRFIIKDIMNKINKIKSGNIESIEQDNIKGDML